MESQTRKMLRDDSFIKHMNDTEKAAWNNFERTVENFLCNKKSENYKEIVAKMVENFRALGCNMNFKLHFLDSHINYFPMNLGTYSEEQGEIPSKHQRDGKTIPREMECQYDGRLLLELEKRNGKKGVKRKKKPLLNYFMINMSVIIKKMSEKNALSEYGIKNCITVKKQG